ncbi:MAG: apolipoprotein N-acyltransferase [Pseudomonadota bacterium]
MPEPAALGARLTGWYSARTTRVQLGLAGLAGVLTGLGQVPFALYPLGVAGLFALYVLTAAADTPRRAAILGWSFGTGYFALTLHWIVEPFLVDIARHGWMAPFALVFLSGGLALFWGAAAALARWGGHTPLRFAMIWPLALAAFELARGYVLTGFPWAMIGYLWTETPVLYWSRLVGPYGVTFLTLALVAATALALRHRKSLAWCVAPVVPFAAFVVGGAALAPVALPIAPDAPVIRLIQPNAPQHQKWDPDWIPVFFRRQLEFTAAPAARSPDLVVWSETSLPWRLDRADDALRYMSEASGGTPVIVGLLRRDGAQAHNSLAVVDADGAVAAVYDKHHLVPFGEYIPLGHLAAYAGIGSLAARGTFGYTPGAGPQILDMGPLGTMLPLICYEAIFPHNITAAPSRPDWLLHITNDAWFGQTAGPYQHLAQARARAVETGLPVVRVANTGVSAMIDARGQVTHALGLGQAGYVDAPLPPAGAPTLYSRTGDGPLAAALIAALAALALTARRGGARTNRD